MQAQRKKKVVWQIELQDLKDKNEPYVVDLL